MAVTNLGAERCSCGRAKNIAGRRASKRCRESRAALRAASKIPVLEALEERINFGYPEPTGPRCRRPNPPTPPGPPIYLPMGPTPQSETSAPVRYADGQLQYSSTDLSSGGFAVPWGITRSWTNQPAVSLDNHGATANRTGNGWYINEIPQLVTTWQTRFGGPDDRVTVLYSATDTRVFDPIYDGFDVVGYDKLERLAVELWAVGRRRQSADGAGRNVLPPSMCCARTRRPRPK